MGLWQYFDYEPRRSKGDLGMTKGIIVLNDIPVICAECNFATITPNKEYLRCEVKNRIIYNAKPDWCPIKPMIKRKLPSKFTPAPLIKEYYFQYDEGWNDCLDEIEGRM